MVIGILIGWLAPDFAPNLKPFANIFLRMIKSLIVPLLFSTLVVGIAGHGDDMKKVGKLALRSIIYFEVVTTAALAIGLIAVNFVKPGVGLSSFRHSQPRRPPSLRYSSIRFRKASLKRQHKTKCSRSCSLQFSLPLHSHGSRDRLSESC